MAKLKVRRLGGHCLLTGGTGHSVDHNIGMFGLGTGLETGLPEGLPEGLPKRARSSAVGPRPTRTIPDF